MTEIEQNLRFRAPVAQDLNLILESFQLALKMGTTWGHQTLGRVFKKEAPKVIDRILHDSTTLVACSKESEDTVVGFIIYEPNIIHFVFVKKGFWRRGIARALFEKAGFNADNEIQCSFRTKITSDIFLDHPNLTYNPFINFKQLSKETSNG